MTKREASAWPPLYWWVSIAGFERRTWVVLIATLAGLGALYLSGLGGVGLLGPDEPRYASIGRAMATTGDWITPRLNGEPWYEKPPLLYWLVAAGHRAGLGDDLAPRAGVAVLSIAFLLAQFAWLRRLYGECVAWLATWILATTAGWCAYSQVGVTDLPLAVSLNAALWLALWWLEFDSRRALYGAAVALALAVLAKGLVPLVLALPLLWLARRRWRELGGPAAVFLLAVSPWYVAMMARHGWAFIDEFFIRHHFSRFASTGLQHVQPWWFYIPVLVGGLFPWPTLLATLDGNVWRERRLRAPLAMFAFGLVFFSASTNKLPGYLLPLLPPLVVMLARGVERSRYGWRELGLAAALTALMPAVASVLPQALLNGLRRASMGELRWDLALAVLAVAVAAGWLARRGHLLGSVAIVAITAGAGLGWVKYQVTPALEQTVSSRGLWRRVEPYAGETCIDSLHRSRRYGLDYYSVKPLPDCAGSARNYQIVQPPNGLPRLQPRR